MQKEGGDRAPGYRGGSWQQMLDGLKQIRFSMKYHIKHQGAVCQNTA